MVKRNILGILTILSIIGAFYLGYLVGNSAQQSSESPRGIPRGNERVRKVENEQSIRTGQNREGRGLKSHPSRAESTLKPPLMETEKVPDKAINYAFYGYTSPYEAVNVQGKQGGIIVMLTGKEGNAVKKGDTLVIIDSNEIQLQLQKSISARNAVLQQVNQAESNYLTNKAIFDRNKPLYEQGVISKQQWDEIINKLDSAKSSWESSKENLQQARLQVVLNEESLRNHQIVSPISGIIETKKYNLDEVYKSGEVIYHLVNIDNIYVEANVSENYINHMKQSMSVKVSFDAIGQQKFDGRIESLLPTKSNDSNSFVIKVLVKNPHHAIKPGMFAKVEIELEG